MNQTEDDRFIHGKLNYPGNCEEKLNKHPDLKHQPFGPCPDGQQWWFVEAQYLVDFDKTRAFFSLNPPKMVT